MSRRGNYIQTASGKLFWPLDPLAEEVELDDIAHALSRMCRWTGHVREFYSVAQHACMVAELVRPVAPHLALAALHHDSAEAYLSDICSPTKKFLFIGTDDDDLETFSDAEHKIEQAIFEALAIPLPDAMGRSAIKTADRAALRLECENLMHPFPDGDWIYTIGLIDRPWETPWTPTLAKHKFLELHRSLSHD